MSFLRRLLGRADDADEIDSLPEQDDAPNRRPEQGGGQSESVTGAAVETQDMTHQRFSDQADLDTGGFADPAGSAGIRSPHTAAGLRVGYVSDVGRLRGHNEDTLIAFQGVHLGYDVVGPFGFFIVADGMGGHKAGEVASSLAARQVTHQVVQNVYLPFLLKQAPSAEMDPLPEILRRAVEEANSLVHKQVPGGGTTLTCTLILGRRAYIAHVGDSRAYLLAGRDMRQLTKDHSFVGRLIELGELSREEAAVHPQRHVLYRAVGQGDNLDIDTYQQPLPPGSRLLLCSDGLSGVVPEEEIGRIIASASTPQEACDKLVETANHAGGPDNITAVLIETPLD